MPTFDLEPRVNGPVKFGSNRGENLIYAGRLAERGNTEKLTFDASDNFVVLEVGKRGSGKSYGMAAMLESFATGPTSQIGTHHRPRAVLLLDPLDVHWTAIEPLRPDGPEGLIRQHRVLERWRGLEVEPVNVRVFMPAGFEHQFDPHAFQSYALPVAELTVGDWAHLLSCDLVNEPRGRLVDEIYRKVRELGWKDGGTPVDASPHYTVTDLIRCAENDSEVARVYQESTIRSVVQPLRSLAAMPLFGSATGTPLTTLVSAGVFSILCMGRLPASLRTVLTTVLVRLLRADRMLASQIQRRLSLISTSEDERDRLVAELDKHVPRTILAIDEAQILMPAKGGAAGRRELDAYVLEGRNYGLSLWMATQRPKGAVSGAAASQIDTFIVHRLSVKEDIVAMCGLLQNAMPTKVKLNTREITLEQLIRSLETGQAVFSSGVSNAPRLVVANIRPRVVAHGGESF